MPTLLHPARLALTGEKVFFNVAVDLVVIALLQRQSYERVFFHRLLLVLPMFCRSPWKKFRSDTPIPQPFWLKPMHCSRFMTMADILTSQVSGTCTKIEHTFILSWIWFLEGNFLTIWRMMEHIVKLMLPGLSLRSPPRWRSCMVRRVTMVLCDWGLPASWHVDIQNIIDKSILNLFVPFAIL